MCRTRPPRIGCGPCSSAAFARVPSEAELKRWTDRRTRLRHTRRGRSHEGRSRPGANWPTPCSTRKNSCTTAEPECRDATNRITAPACAPAASSAAVSRRDVLRAGPRSGFGWLAFKGLFATSASARAAARRQSEEHHLLLHGWRAEPRRHVRLQADAQEAPGASRSAPAPCRNGRSRRPSASGSAAPGSSSSAARAGCGSATCSRTWRRWPTSCASSARWSASCRCTANRTCCCTPAASRPGAQLRVVGVVRPGQREPQPARLRRPEQRLGAQRRAGELRQFLPAGQPSGDDDAGQRRAGGQHHADGRRRSPASQTRPARRAGRRLREGRLGRPGDRGGHRELRDGVPDADRRSRHSPTSAANPRRSGGCTASTRRTSTSATTPPGPAGAAAGRGGRAASSRSPARASTATTRRGTSTACSR